MRKRFILLASFGIIALIAVMTAMLLVSNSKTSTSNKQTPHKLAEIQLVTTKAPEVMTSQVIQTKESIVSTRKTTQTNTVTTTSTTITTTTTTSTTTTTTTTTTFVTETEPILIEQECIEQTVITDPVVEQSYQETVEIVNGIIINGNVINIAIAPATQEYVDMYDVVQNNDESLFSCTNNVTMFGHNYRSFNCLFSVRVGDEITLINNGIASLYRVFRSEEGYLNEYNTDVLSFNGGESLFVQDFGCDTLRLVTCTYSGSWSNRWIVLAEKIQ